MDVLKWQPPTIDNFRQWIDRRQLQRLGTQGPSKSSNHTIPSTSPASSSESHLTVKGAPFQIHAWRWHHLGIVHDLRRLASASRLNSTKLCSSTSVSSSSNEDEKEHMKAALRYILHDNWAVHDKVEQKLLFPWLSSYTPSFHTPASVIAERCRLDADSKSLTSAVNKWANHTKSSLSSSTESVSKCKTQLNGIIKQMEILAMHAEQLFQASEAIVIPFVSTSCTEKDQKKFNNSVLKKLTKREVRIAAIGFKSAINESNPNATEEDRSNFRATLPSIVRKVGIPYWRKKFVKREVEFIEKGNNTARVLSNR